MVISSDISLYFGWSNPPTQGQDPATAGDPAETEPPAPGGPAERRESPDWAGRWFHAVTEDKRNGATEKSWENDRKS